MYRIPVASFLAAALFTSTMVNLKAAPPESSAPISFPPSSAQKWILPNGLTIIVQEDRSAPVASVQAWCATGSIDEDPHLGAGLSHILEHMLLKERKHSLTNPDRAEDPGRRAVTSMPTHLLIARFFGSTCRKMALATALKVPGRRDDEFRPPAGRISKRAGSHPARVRHGHGRSRSHIATARDASVSAVVSAGCSGR